MDVSLSPLVSIVITNYNREKTIATAIESALVQDYPNLEIIISDNCSTDDSVNIIKKYIDDPRIRFFQNEKNIGMLGNFKICFEERVKGEWISIVNSDDEYINPYFISQSIQLINDNYNVSIVKSGYVISSFTKDIYNKFDDLNEFYENKDFIELYNHNIDLSWMGILMRKDMFKNYNFFENNIIASDNLTSMFFLLHGNICFNKNYSYKLNFSNTSASYSAFNEQQIHLIFSEYDFLFKKINEILNVNTNKFKDNVHFSLIKLIVEMILSCDRSLLSDILKILRKKNKEMYNKYIFSFRFIKLYVIYFIPFFGHFVTKLKNRIFA
jgi:glycosyltransferase involved in cell wall biosynthesis